MASGLIGYSGLVGGNLLRQAPFEGRYNSKNIEDIAGRHYDLLVCAGAPAAKWLANRDPENDRRTLARLTSALEEASTNRLVLISTIDVYPDTALVTEDDLPDVSRQQPYGRHRHELELFCRERFPTLVVRLPALFGPGLKKNIVYDFLHNNQVDKIHCDSAFQFYCLDRLWSDIRVALRHGLETVHFATEPVTVRDVAAVGFGFKFDNRPPGEPARYDFRTNHAAQYGRDGGYLCTWAEVLDALANFVQSERSKLGETGDLQSRLVA